MNKVLSTEISLIYNENGKALNRITTQVQSLPQQQIDLRYPNKRSADKLIIVIKEYLT